ncbi:MAG TPA: GTPase HflX [Acidimicrobiales bacterium]|nr:GTPase HflX [Acidimicrobiales bacterium]
MTLIDRSFREKIVLVGVVFGREDVVEVEGYLDELALLVDTAGADVEARVLQRRDAPDPATYIGKGKAEELHELSLTVDADTVVFDDELSPAQQRNLEKILGRTAIDRTDVILDIFAQNARTLEGKAQVELALLRHRLPRLRGRGKTLSQQGGNSGFIGTRGPGETQLEVDRRRLQRRITALEQELKQLAKKRSVQSAQRLRSRLHNVSIAGYTNAGKSTLLNALTDADVLAENRLFATLDARTRRLDLAGGETILVSDTVGFIRKLPHQLVEAFRSTLEVVLESELIVHVVDASAPNPEAQMATVREVLAEIGGAEIPELLVFNKADLNPAEAERLVRAYPGSVAVSAKTGAGIDGVLNAVSEVIRANTRVIDLDIPFARGDVLAAVHREGEVLQETHGERGTRVTVRVDPAGAARFDNWVVSE